MIVVHTSCFDESTELEEMLKIFEQKQDLTHLHLQHLKDDEDWDEALDLIIKADHIISILDVFPSFDSFNKRSYFTRIAWDFFNLLKTWKQTRCATGKYNCRTGRKSR